MLTLDLIITKKSVIFSQIFKIKFLYILLPVRIFRTARFYGFIPLFAYCKCNCTKVGHDISLHGVA